MKKDELLTFRPSSIAEIMAKGVGGKSISVGAKTYLKKKFKEIYLGYKEELDSKEISKGIQQEQQGIDLLNLYYEKDYYKNWSTKFNGYVRGTADIVTENYIRDVKLPWSKKSHPLFKEDALNSRYEWQLRAYMWLYNKDYAYLDYCLIPTNPELVPTWESYEAHDVESLPLKYRITTVRYDRDYSLEQMMIERIQACREEWEKMLNQYK